MAVAFAIALVSSRFVCEDISWSCSNLFRACLPLEIRIHRNEYLLFYVFVDLIMEEGAECGNCGGRDHQHYWMADRILIWFLDLVRKQVL